MHPKNTIRCHAGGMGMPSHTIAWISTPIADIEATLAAIVCM